MPHRNTHAAAVDHRDGNPGGRAGTPEKSRTHSVTRRDALAAMLSLGAAVPLGACKQQSGRTEQTRQTWRVGLLLAGMTDEAIARQRHGIVERLEQHGFVEGQNLRIEVRRAGHSPDEDAEAVRLLVAWQPDAILVDTSTLNTRIQKATRTIPIVFTGVGDPIVTGLINDFARPGGNTTGVHYSQLGIGAKRLELLRDLLPQARRVMVVRYLGGGESRRATSSAQYGIATGVRDRGDRSVLGRA